MYKEFSKEFKMEAVNLAEQIGVTAACEKLGIARNNLYRWKEEYARAGETAFAEKKGAKQTFSSPKDAEIARLSKENRELKQANRILQEAMVFFVKGRK